MRVRAKDGKEVCTNCGKDWIAAEKYPQLCDNCFCPQSYCNAVDDIAWYQSGLLKELIGDPLTSGAVSDARKLIEEQLSTAVPPMTFEELCEKQPIAKRLFIC